MPSQHIATTEENSSTFSKTCWIIALFSTFCVALSYVPSPWWKGDMLDISVRWPKDLEALGLKNVSSLPVESVLTQVETGAPTIGEVLPSESDLTKIHEELVAQQAAAKELAQAELARQKEKQEKRAHEEQERIIKENQKLIASLHAKKPAIPLTIPCLLEGEGGRCKLYALDHFFSQLREVALKKSTEPVRISQYGDSLISGDGLTGRIRYRLQNRFGYGGHGYIPPTVPARYMGFQGIRVSSDNDWSIDSISKSKRKRKLGFGGASFKPTGSVSLSIREENEKRHFSRLGMIVDEDNPPEHVKVIAKTDDGEQAYEISSDQFKQGVAWIDLKPTTEVKLSDFSRGSRYYGVFAENKGGVVVDNVGMLSAKTTSLLAMDAPYWSKQLKARGADLVSFSFGTNSATVHKPSQKWLKNYSQVYQSILNVARQGNPTRNCLVLGILTRGYKNEEGDVLERSSVRPLAEAQREAALASGCAFWNMNDAIDKAGPIAWYDNKPQLIGSDFTHPTRAGYKKLGDLFYEALIYEFSQYLSRAR